MIDKDTISFQIKEIDISSWSNLKNSIDRSILNKDNKKWETRSLEDYFRELIHKLSKLNKEDINKIIDPNIKIKLENK